MTVYSNTASGFVIRTIKVEQPSVYKLNYILSAAVVILIVGYTFLANLLVSQKYTLEVRKRELNALATMTKGKNDSEFPDLTELLLYAQKSGMIESKDTESIIQDGNFALTSANH